MSRYIDLNGNTWDGTKLTSKIRHDDRYGAFITVGWLFSDSVPQLDLEEHDKAIKELKEYKDLEKRGLLLRLPVTVGSKIYEIIEDTVPEHHFYIAEYKVQDVSATAVKYADDWYSFDYPNLYFERVAAEEKLKELEGELNEEIN